MKSSDHIRRFDELHLATLTPEEADRILAAIFERLLELGGGPAFDELVPLGCRQAAHLRRRLSIIARERLAAKPANGSLSARLAWTRERVAEYRRPIRSEANGVRLGAVANIVRPKGAR